jgi:hypothetical protein
MPAYAGVSFDVVKSSDGLSEGIERPKHVSITHYPDTDTDEIQFGGKGTPRVTLKVYVYTQAGCDALEAAWGPTVRALTGWRSDADSINAMLIDVKPFKRPPKGWAQDLFIGELTFAFEGA